MFKKVLRLILVWIMVILLTTNVFAEYFNVWKAIQKANEYETSQELDKALPLWIDIIKYYEKQEKDEGIYTNLAIFSKKVGKYYDGIKDYENAVIYYEKENEYWNEVGVPWGAEDMLRAEEIRTIFEYYIEVDVEESLELAKYEPEAGIYAGIYSENDKKIGQKFNKTKTVYGDHAQYILYQNWNQLISNQYYIDVPLATRMKRENAAYHVAMNAMSGLDSVTENFWIVNWAKEANELDMPIFLRFLGEMNGDWVPWNGDPEKYIEKFRLVHDVMEKYAPNVAMVWTPNDSPVESGGIRIEDYYPGDDYVDWVGVNFYIDYYDSGDPENGSNHLQNPLAHLDYIYDMYSDKKPIMISETGVTHYSITTKEDLTDWAIENLKKLYTQLPIKYPKVKAINYFSLNQANKNYLVGNRWNNYAISENKEFMDAYIKLVNSEYYLGNMSESVDKTFVEFTDLRSFREQEEIFFLIKITDYKINKVEFYHDDKLISTDYDLPYSYSGDLTNVDELVIKVYDSNNELSTTRTLSDVIEEEVVPQGAIELFVPYVSGYGDGNFRAESYVTRAEVATMFSRALKLNTNILGEKKYADVDEEHWAYKYVQSVNRTGMFKGYDDKTFKPDAFITKAELAQVLSDYLKFDGYVDKDIIKYDLLDIPSDHWGLNAINEMVNTDLFGDLRFGEFNSDDYISRGQAVNIINKITGRPTNHTGARLFDDIFDDGDVDAASQTFIREYFNK